MRFRRLAWLGMALALVVAPLSPQGAALASSVPVISSLAPVEGPIAGGTTVVITGSGFTGVTGASSVSFGGTDAASYTVDSDTQITAVSPAGSSGEATVVVTNANGPSTSEVEFTFAPVPTVTNISPLSGPTAGSTSITLTGTGFHGGGSSSSVSGVTVDGNSATSVTVTSDTSLTAVTPAGTAGAKNVVVTTAGGSSSASTFTYMGTPTISSLSPASGADTGGTFVTVTGTGFLAGGESTISGVTVGGVAATSIDNVTSTTFTMVTPAGTAGAQDVIVTTTGGSSTAASFTYGAAADFPVITSLSKTSGSVAGGTTEIVITGTGFAASGNQVWIGSEQGVITAQSATAITFSTNSRTTPANGTGLTVGPKIVRVKAPIDPSDLSLGYRDSGEEKYFSFVPTLLTPTNAVVQLGALADRSQGKPLTQNGLTLSGTTGKYGSSGAAYSYTTDRAYSGTGQLTESTEVSSSASFSSSLNSSSGEWQLSTSDNCSHSNRAKDEPLGVGGRADVSGTTSYCSYFGPQLWSEPFYATGEQSIAFTWRAQGGSDDYEVYAFLVNVGTNQAGYGTAGPYATFPNDHTNILYSRGKTTSSTTSAADIPVDGLYRFRFVNGTFDRSGGFALGATMFVSTSVSLGQSNTITFAQPKAEREAGDPDPFTVTASASSGQEVTFAASGACEVSSTSHSGSVTSAVILRSTVASNSCTLTASQDAFGLYAPAASVSRTFTYPTVSAPGAPTNLVAAAANGGASIAFTAPTNNGGAAISNYQYRIDAGSWVTLSPASTATTIVLTGLSNGTTYSVEVRAVNLRGSGTASAAVTVTPAVPAVPVTPAGEETTAAPSVPPIIPGPIVRRIQPQPALLPQILRGPVLRGNVAPAPPVAPFATVGGRTTTTQTQVTSPTGFNLRTGVLNLGLEVEQDGGVVRQDSAGGLDIEVKKGSTAAVSGSGFLPRSTVQVFLPLQGTNAKEIARIPVDEGGTFSGDAVFATRVNERPLPIGRQVLQVVSLDEEGQQSVVEMTVNIAQAAPAPEPDRTAGATPTLRPGQFLATNAGEPEVVTVIPVPENRQARVEGDGWQMAVDIPSAGGSVAPSDEGGALLQLVRDEAAVVSGSGFMPGTRADVWLFSEPTLLGTVDIDENGQFTGEVNIDANVVAVGEHTLQLQGVGEDGYVRAANLGVVVNDTVAEVTTEEAVGGFLWWLWLVVALVAVLLVIVLWRYRRKSEA